ncbi:MAG: hypothetical protein E6G60_18085 [Actinobacteria bacterium]|nr:MAG: hypothetical protein E6G60_18085 [Actinomycetota bacterium]
MAVALVDHPDRSRQAARVLVVLRARMLEVGPEVQLELELRRVPAEEGGLEEARCLGVLGRVLLGQAEVPDMPARLAGDRLADVRVDLGQRVIAGDAAERVRERGVDARVVQRVSGLVQERLVIVQASLCAGDQVDDLRRVGGDHAGPRGLLRPVVQVEANGRLGHVEPERGHRLETDFRRAFLRVDRLERREPADVREVRGRRLLLALGTEQPLEPLLSQREEALRDLVVRGLEHRRELAHGDLLFLLAPRDRVGLAGQIRLQLLVCAQQLEPLLVEARRCLVVDLAELVPVGVRVEHGELRLRRAERHLLAFERHARREDRVLQLVVALGELGRDEAAFAGLPEPVQPLALLGAGPLLLLAERAELVAAEEIRVARDDRRLLGDLLLAHANGAPLFGALVQVPLDLFLEFRRRADGRRRHLADSIQPRRVGENRRKLAENRPEPRTGGGPFTYWK